MHSLLLVFVFFFTHAGPPAVHPAVRQRIAALNRLQDHAVFGPTKFTHLSPEEFRALYLGFRGPFPRNCSNAAAGPIVPAGAAARRGRAKSSAAIDWRAWGAVTPVKNQGPCGSCWAFSTVETLESQLYIAGYPLRNYSAQQLVDCSGGYGNDGCEGGLMDGAAQYLRESRRLCTDEEYPYVGDDGPCAVGAGVSCRQGAPPVGGCVAIPEHREDLMLDHLNSGPLYLALAAEVLQSYRSGIVTAKVCRGPVDHALELVGAGELDNLSYWVVRNSWGADWGEQGYFRVERDTNACKLSSYVGKLLL